MQLWQDLTNHEIWNSNSKFCSFYVLIKAFLLNNMTFQKLHLWKKKSILDCISSFIKSFESVHFKAKSYQILSNFESHSLKLHILILPDATLYLSCWCTGRKTGRGPRIGSLSKLSCVRQKKYLSCFSL